MHRFLFTNFKIINQMAKQYIGSDEHWIDSVNQRYDENEKHAKEQMQEQEDNRVQCWKTYLECENYEHYNKKQSCIGCTFQTCA